VFRLTDIVLRVCVSLLDAVFYSTFVSVLSFSDNIKIILFDELLENPTCVKYQPYNLRSRCYSLILTCISTFDDDCNYCITWKCLFPFVLISLVVMRRGVSLFLYTHFTYLFFILENRAVSFKFRFHALQLMIIFIHQHKLMMNLVHFVGCEFCGVLIPQRNVYHRPYETLPMSAIVLKLRRCRWGRETAPSHRRSDRSDTPQLSR